MVAAAVAVVVVGGGALAACSGNTKTAAPPRTTTTITTGRSATPATSAAAPAEVALARTLVLHPRDLPAGWHPIPAPVSGGLNAPARQCVAVTATRRGIERAQGGPVPTASSAYGQGVGRVPVIRSYAYVFANANLAARALTAITSAPYTRCVSRQIMAAGGYSLPRYGAIAVARIGDDAAGNRVTLHTSTGGASFETHIDILGVRTGRVVQQVMFFDADLLPIATGVRNHALAALAAHARASSPST